MAKTYTVPKYVVDDLELHAQDVKRYLSGELKSDIFKARRVPRGIYEQRQDGLFMIRVRIAGGVLWTEQAHKLAELSRRFANGKIHVTTRQDIQLHEVNIADTYQILQELLKVGLTPSGGGGNTVRNVTSCARGGISPAEIFDTQPYALAVTDYLLPFQSSYNLPRKFKIAFSGCADDCTLTGVNDLGFQARIKDGEPGFAVYVGGGLGTRSRTADLFQNFIPARDVLRVVEAVKRLFIKYGDRRNRHQARLRFAVERLGPSNFFAELAEELQRVAKEGIPDAVPVEILKMPKQPSATPDLNIRESGFAEWQKTAVFRQKQPGYVCAEL